MDCNIDKTLFILLLTADEFEKSDLEKETNDPHNTCYQNAIRYKEKENAFIKKL